MPAVSQNNRGSMNGLNKLKHPEVIKGSGSEPLSGISGSMASEPINKSTQENTPMSPDERKKKIAEINS
jgi:hypothetical protein